MFIQTGDVQDPYDYEYLLEAHIHTHPQIKPITKKLFKISKSEYEQFASALASSKKGTGVFFEYTLRSINPIADEYCFERIAE